MVGEVSEDGKWVWDGSNWQPVQTEVIHTLPPTPTVTPEFLTRSRDYKNLTAQLDFLGNSSLASDMRSITPPADSKLKLILLILAIMTIYLVVPMILWITWNARETRNMQKRNQMTDSATIFVKTTPVPSEKVKMISKFQF